MKTYTYIKLVTINFILISILLGSCSRKTYTQQELVMQYLTELNYAKNNLDGNYLILPNQGCSACNTKTVDWLMNNTDLKAKEINIIIGAKFNDQKSLLFLNKYWKVKVDTNNYMSKYQFGVGYPHLIKIDMDGDIFIEAFNKDAENPFKGLF